MNVQEQELLRARFAIELEALGFLPPIQLEMDAAHAWILIGQLQLALRHPGNRGPSAKLARAIVEGLAEIVAPSGALREVYERGWNPAHDEEVSHADPGRTPGRDDPDVRPGHYGAVVGEARHPPQDPRASGR